MGIFKWCFGREKVSKKTLEKTMKVVGDWRSNVIEEHTHKATHYRINNLDGLIQVLDGIERWGSKGVAEIKWWEPGMHLEFSATVDIGVLNELKKKQ